MKKLRLVLLVIILVTTVAPLSAQSEPPVPPEVMELMRSAIAAHKERKWEEAEVKAKKALAISPNDRRIHIFLAYVYLEQNRGKDASESFAIAIKLEPTDKQVYLVKAQVDNLRGAQKEALEGVNKALELDPKFAEAHLLLGQVLEHDDSQSAKAIAAYETALSLDPSLFLAHERLGKHFDNEKWKTEDKKYWKTAEEHFRQSIALDPKHMAGRFELGRILVEQGRLAEARELWEGRISDEDNNIRPTFFEKLQRAENLKRTTEAVAQRPNDPVALVELGFATMEGDSWVVDMRQERALVHFKKALALKPDYARAQYGIVKAYIELASIRENEKKNVDRELAKLQKLDPKLAAEMIQYRKTYTGDLIALPPDKPE